MNVFDDAGATFFALAVSLIAAVLVAITSFFAVLWLGGLIAPGEHILVLGAVTGLACSVITFVFGFRKMRVTG